MRTAAMQALESRAYLATVAFDAAAFYDSGNEPQGVVAGDFNNDQHDDLAITNYDAGTITILLGNTVGPPTPTPFNAIGNLSGVATGDLNKDGNLDLVGTGDKIAILMGNGDGTFDAAVTRDAGVTPQNSTVGDVNLDGKLDIVTSNIESTFATVLLGNGNGTFAAALSPNVNAGQSDAVISDLNGDFIPDLAFSLFGTLDAGINNGMAVLIGNGDGTYAAPVRYAAGSRPFAIASGDFNGDRRVDLVTVNGGIDIFPGSQDFSLFLSNGDGTYAQRVNIATGLRPGDIVVDDFDGDGNDDVATASSGGSDMFVHQGRGDGQFNAPISFAAGSGPNGIATADLNSDGMRDVVVSNGLGATVSVLLNALEPVRLENGVLTIVGTGQADKLDVTVASGTLSVDLNGAQSNFTASTVTRIDIRTAGGADQINAAVAIPLIIESGDGDDRISGGTAKDTIDAGAGNDGVWGNDGEDKVFGGDGEDTLSGGAQKDTLDGSFGNDRLNGNGGHDRLFGAAGVDRLYGYEGNDYLDGGSSGDRLEGSGGIDTILGQSGDDRFFALDGAIDEVYGGKGNDRAQHDDNDVIGSIETRVT